MVNAVTKWFGDHFIELDPLLQQLHVEGGVLKGEVDVRYGKGFAGYLGRRIGRKLGIPEETGVVDFTVVISHDDGCLYWGRQFGRHASMHSMFVPYGAYPTGYGQESAGAVVLTLGVQVRSGAWHWQQRGVSYRGIPLPHCLVPKTTAYKRVLNGKYHFFVSIALPLVGELIRYSGELVADTVDR